MKKRFIWIALCLMLTTSSFSQTENGMQEYYYLNEKATAFTVVPIVYHKTQNNWYFEGRYNYEALNAASIYVGKVFEKKSNFSYFINPVIGLVAGGYKGGSLGMNIKIDFKKYSFSSQPQYTFSIADSKDNFTYSWSELGMNACKYFTGGLVLQQSKYLNASNEMDKGAFIKVKIGHLAVPLYVFEKANKEKYFVLSLNYEWTNINVLKSRNNRTGNINF